jgi:hypothetical protein
MIITVDDARICLDCDIVTDSEQCPACGRNKTFPLAVWLVPLQATQTRPWSGGLRIETGAAARWLDRHSPSRRPRSSGDGKLGRGAPTRWLVVVRSDEPDLYEFLRRRFQAMRSVEVILDRRQTERRRDSAKLTPADRRKQPRRHPLTGEERKWWKLAAFRIVARADSFRLYEAVPARN